MRISQLIADLQKIQEEKGDVIVTLGDENYGGHSLHTAYNAKSDYLTFQDILYTDNDEINTDLVNLLLPNLNFDIENFDDIDEYGDAVMEYLEKNNIPQRIETVNIHTDKIIYYT